MIIIILFRYIFKKLIIIIKRNVNDLSMFRITLIVKIKVVLIMISKLFKFDVVDLKVAINEICDIIFIKNDSSKR